MGNISFKSHQFKKFGHRCLVIAVALAMVLCARQIGIHFAQPGDCLGHTWLFLAQLENEGLRLAQSLTDGSVPTQYLSASSQL